MQGDSEGRLRGQLPSTSRSLESEIEPSDGGRSHKTDSRDSHISEEALELYSLGRLHKWSGWVEEHLLLCERCRRHLGKVGKYASIMVEALRIRAQASATQACVQGSDTIKPV